MLRSTAMGWLVAPEKKTHTHTHAHIKYVVQWSSKRTGPATRRLVVLDDDGRGWCTLPICLGSE